jgi:hypothetical protein
MMSSLIYALICLRGSILVPPGRYAPWVVEYPEDQKSGDAEGQEGRDHEHDDRREDECH